MMQHFHPNMLPANSFAKAPLFTTGSGKRLSVSAQSLDKARLLLQESDGPEMCSFSFTESDSFIRSSPMLDSSRSNAPLFTTGSGKQLSVSSESLLKARRLFADENEETDGSNLDCMPPLSKLESSFSGATKSKSDSAPMSLFTSGSGKRISVSTESLAKAKKLLTDDHNSGWDASQLCQADKKLCDPDESQREGSSSILRIARDELRNQFADTDAVSESDLRPLARLDFGHAQIPFGCELERPATLSGQLPVFSTGTGKRLHVSKESLAKARRLLDDGTEPLDNPSNGMLQSFPQMMSNEAPSDPQDFLKQCVVSHPSSPATVASVGPFLPVLTPIKPVSAIKPRLSLQSGGFLTPSPRITSDVPSAKSASCMDRPRTSLSFETPQAKRAKFRSPRLTRPSEISPAPSVPNASPPLRLVTSRPTASVSRTFLYELVGGRKPALSDAPGQSSALNPEMSALFQFSDGVCADKVHAVMLDGGAVSGLCTLDWVRNHYKWIVWKLSSVARGYPELSHRSYFTSRRVIDQLWHRYTREVERAERSCIRRILEGDDAASRFMVLCIADVIEADDAGGGTLCLPHLWFAACLICLLF